MLRDEAAAAAALQKEVTRKQQAAGHYILHSFPIIAITSETSKLLCTFIHLSQILNAEA